MTHLLMTIYERMVYMEISKPRAKLEKNRTQNKVYSELKKIQIPCEVKNIHRFSQKGYIWNIQILLDKNPTRGRTACEVV